MTREEFFSAAREIALFFGATSPSTHRMDLWFQSVEHIPSEAVGEIVKAVTGDLDSMPRNLPRVFRDRFDAWMRLHPERRAREAQQTGCIDCDRGVLWLEKRDQDGGVAQTCCVFCRCFTGNAGAIGRASLWEMQQLGWNLRPKADQ